MSEDMAEDPTITHSEELKRARTVPFIDLVFGRIFNDNHTVTGYWGLKNAPGHQAPTSIFSPVGPAHNPPPSARGTQRRFRFDAKHNPEVESLRMICERLLDHQAAQDEKIKQLQNLVANAQFPPAQEIAPLLAMGTAQPRAAPPVRNPWHLWISAHLSELKAYRGRSLVIDYEHGVVLEGEDPVELSDKLEEYLQRQAHPQETRARLMLTQASYYLDEG